MLKKRLLILAAFMMSGIITLPMLANFSQQFFEKEEDNELVCWFKNGSAPVYDEETIEYAAQFDFIAHAPGSWRYRQDAIKELKKKNIDIMIGEYFPVNTFGPWILNQEGNLNHYYGRLMAAVDGRWAVSSTGDTASIWKNHPMYDFIDPDVRHDIITVAVEYVRENNIDWFMCDYFQTMLQQYNFDYPGVEGFLDLDRDGIPQREWVTDEHGNTIVIKDEDEIQLMYEANLAYLTELKERLPKEFLVIPNGNLAIFNDEFAALADGIYIEKFPYWFFGTQEPNLPNALDPEYPQSLHNLTAEGRYNRNPGFVFLGDPTNENGGYMDWRHIANQFPGCVATFNQQGWVNPDSRPVLEPLNSPGD